MRALIPLLSYAAISFLVAPSSAYYIDPTSCAAVHDKIVTSMDEIINTIAPSVRAGITSGSLNDLFGFIFGTRANDAKINAGEHVFSAATANVPGLATLETAMNNNQVRFFCDEKRYQRNTEKDSRFRDTVNQDWVIELEKPDCTSGKEAYTIVSRGAKNQDGEDIPGKIAIITFCPAYLQKVGVAKVTSLGGLKGKLGELFKAGGRAILKSFGRKHIDALFVFTHTVLHELMHSNFMGVQGVGHGRIDGSVGGANKWTDIRNLATTLPAATQNNADSWAYLGLGAQIISENLVITQNGCIKKAGSPSTDQDQDCDNDP